MYLDAMNFLGIGTQQGQRRSGLVASPELALSLLPLHWPMKSTQLLKKLSPHRCYHKAEELEHLHWSIYQEAYSIIRNNLLQGPIQLNWGGDHSIGISTVAAFTSVYPDGHVLWIDAHADLNTPESSPTGNFHGMPISLLLGIGTNSGSFLKNFFGTLRTDKIIYFGLRDLDPYEKYLLEFHRIKTIYCEDINNQNFTSILSKLISYIGTKPLHISFDIDSVDPAIAPSTGVRCKDGLCRTHLQLLAQSLNKQGQIKSIDVVEINPEIGSHSDVMQTFSVAFEFLEILLNLNGGKFYDGVNQSNKEQVQNSNQWNSPFWP